jgi:1,4-alpha-glucan branching enzyme
MWTHPGAKLLFMGNEFGQTTEWDFKSELQWPLLKFDSHSKLKKCVADLNHLLKAEKALYQNQFKPEGFEWVDLNHRDESVMVFKRKGLESDEDLLIILNMTPVVRPKWEIYVTGKVFKREIFNSDSLAYWGTGDVYNPEIQQELINEKENLYKLIVNLPPLSGIILK